MSRIRTIIGYAGAVTAVLVLAACGSTSPSNDSAAGTSGAASGSCTPKHADLATLTPGTLKVVAFVSPPYVVQNGDSFAGVDGLIVKQLADMECFDLQVQSVTGPALAPTVESKRADVAIGGIYYSEDRASKFSLTTPMYHDGLSLLSKSGVDSLDGLSGKTLGVIQGYLWNAEFQQALGNDHVKLYQSSAAMIADLEAGRIEAAALTSAEAGYRAKSNSSLKAALMQSTPKVTESQIANNVVLLLASQSTALADAFSADIKTLLADGSIKHDLTTNGMDGSLAGSAS